MLRILYLLAALGVLSSFDIFWDYPMVHSISKGLLMPILITMVILKGKECKARFFLIAALACSWAGDLLLLGDEDSFFLGGLSAFLVAHIFYIITFRKAREDNHEIPATSKLPLFYFLFLAIAASIFLSLRNFLGEMELPVLLYTLVIMVMALQALNRSRKTSGKSFRMVFLGALIFMLSDTLLAWNMFRDELEFGRYLIIGTYALAQWLIVEGILAHPEKK